MISGSPIVDCFRRAALARSTRDASSSRDQPNEVPATSVISDDDTNTAPSTAKQTHSTHNVLSIAQRKSIVAWMRAQADEHGEHKIASRTVTNFPQFFRGSVNANLTRASRLWKARANYSDENTRNESSVITRVTKNGPRMVRMKARAGRGRRRVEWVDALQNDVRSEFDRLRKLGVKFNISSLHSLTLRILSTSENPEYSANMIDPLSDKRLLDKVNQRWVQSFMERFRIVSRAHTGKYKLSPAKELQLEVEVAKHLGEMQRMLSDGSVDENDLGNADETHFQVNMDNGRTLGFAGATDVKYSDVVSGGEGMTMVVRLSGGRDAKIECPFLVFMNKDRSYPIRGVPDCVDGVAYRSGPKGWMDRVVMPQWISERRVFNKLPNNRCRTLFVDNCSGHTETDALREALRDVNTEIRYFPPNTTHLLQPCDSFVIQKLKSCWNKHWEKYKMEMIEKGMWKDSTGKLLNPGKSFFLKLAARVVREVNHQRDENGITYARKAMILTGMALSVNGQWQVEQLTPELQKIVKKHPEAFEGREHLNEN